MSDEVFSLALTSSNTNSNPLNNPILRTAGNYADVSWLVNWDELFGDKIKQYKHCRVRFNLTQGGATYSYNSQMGYLAASFQTDYNANTTCMPTILGMLYPRQTVHSGSVTDLQIYAISTLDECGVDINIESLYGRQYLNLKWCNDDAFTPLANITTDYQIMLTFQLYN